MEKFKEAYGFVEKYLQQTKFIATDEVILYFVFILKMFGFCFYFLKNLFKKIENIHKYNKKEDK